MPTSPRRRTLRNTTTYKRRARCRRTRPTGTICTVAGMSMAGMSGVSCSLRLRGRSADWGRQMLPVDIPERPCLVSLLRGADRVTPPTAAAACSSCTAGCIGTTHIATDSPFSSLTATRRRTTQAHKAETHVTDTLDTHDPTTTHKTHYRRNPIKPSGIRSADSRLPRPTRNTYTHETPLFTPHLYPTLVTRTNARKSSSYVLSSTRHISSTRNGREGPQDRGFQEFEPQDS